VLFRKSGDYSCVYLSALGERKGNKLTKSPIGVTLLLQCYNHRGEIDVKKIDAARPQPGAGD